METKVKKGERLLKLFKRIEGKDSYCIEGNGMAANWARNQVYEIHRELGENLPNDLLWGEIYSMVRDVLEGNEIEPSVYNWELLEFSRQGFAHDFLDEILQSGLKWNSYFDLLAEAEYSFKQRLASLVSEYFFNA